VSGRSADVVGASSGDAGWLERLRERGAVLEGHFRLTSGLHSPVYVQCARLLQHPQDASAAGAAIVERLAPLVGAPPDVVVSPAIGGIVLGHEVARAWSCRAIWAERDTAAPGAPLVFRRGFAIEPGERVVAVEDVVTTAGSLRELVELATRGDGNVLGLASIVDRRSPGARATTGDLPWATLAVVDAPRYDPDACPQCAAGLPIVKPGSRPDPTA
jgi:orotate phosphoribosyltransferase